MKDVFFINSLSDKPVLEVSINAIGGRQKNADDISVHLYTENGQKWRAVWEKVTEPVAHCVTLPLKDDEDMEETIRARALENLSKGEKILIGILDGRGYYKWPYDYGTPPSWLKCRKIITL